MKNDKNLFPLYVDLSEDTVVIFGGGLIAGRRIRTLLRFTDKIIIIAPDVLPKLEEMADQGVVQWIKKKYEIADLHDADIVLAATNDPDVNHEIYRSCKIFGIPVNNASSKEECDFQFPGIITKDEVVISFNSGGKNYKRTKQLRMMVEEFLDGVEDDS